MKNLEKITGAEEVIPIEQGVPSEAPRGLLGRVYDKVTSMVTNYVVDVSAGLLANNPIMALGEYFIAGMDSDEIKASRIGASIAQAICMRPSGMLRNKYASHYGLTKESPWYQKGLSDTAAILTLQIPAYSIALSRTGATLPEAAKAMGVAILVTALTNNGTKMSFGRFMDKWRKLWGKKPAIK